ncbi:response regulator transcription factor [Zavarzinella formosa]|uniref:hypothetical protein n=1 Tax=Zavarzinella formosa TaxID=360055 RepID=UPI00031B8D98|nr:hypothetical protein [Zavarzinella formosa]
MSCRIALTSLLLLASCPLVGLAQPDSDFYLVPKTVPEFWRAARFELRTGSYERAAERIKGLLALNPDEKTLFDLAENPPVGGESGVTQFLKLRNIPRWNVNDKLNGEAKENVEKLISQVTTAVNNELKSEVRINRFIKALVGEQEESAYAIKELRRSGKAVVPLLCSILSNKPDDETRNAIFQAIPQLGDDTIPGFVAYLSIAEQPDQVELISCFQKRGDFREMVSRVQSDPVPTLLYLWGNPNSAATVKNAALRGATLWTLKDPTLSAKPEMRTAVGQLTAVAKGFLEGKPNPGSPTGNDMGTPTYQVWMPEGKTVKEVALSKSATFEYYGLRYARWVLELEPDNAAAQEIFLSIAIEGQANRTGGTLPLSKTAPQLNSVLSTASYSLLTSLLEDAMRNKKTAITLAVVRTLGERAELRAGKSEEIRVDGEKTKFRPSVLVKALDYPDPRVKFAAADALLKIPGEPTHGRTDEIMKLLMATLAADPPAGAKQKALYADPDPVRGNGISTVLQQSGYQTEVVNTGRELMKRIQQSTDVDFVVIDRHIVDPMLTDLLPQLRADLTAKTLPLFVVASAEGITPVNKLTALARLATIVAFQDLPDAPYREWPRNEAELRELRLLNNQMVAAVLGRYEAQVKRMTTMVQQAGFTLDDQTRNRISYLTLQTIPFVTLDSFAQNLLLEERLDAIKLLPPGVSDELAGQKIAQIRPRIATDETPSKPETENILNLMRTTNEAESALLADRLPRMNATWDSFWSKETPRLPAIVGVRHPDIEMAVARKIRGYNRVHVLPAVFTPAGLSEELVQLIDPKAPMVSPEERRDQAATAMNWFRKMARGEVLGYRVMQAEAQIRHALNSDELALIAIDTIVRMPSKTGQQDLATIATSDTRPAPIRIAAAEGLIRSVQTYGKFVTPEQIDALVVIAKTTEDADVKAKLNSVIGVLKPDAKVTGGLLKTYTPDLSAAPMKEKGPDPKEDPKDPEKKEPDPKEKM